MKTGVFQDIGELDACIKDLKKISTNDTAEKKCVEDVTTCFQTVAKIWRKQNDDQVKQYFII